MSGAITTGSLKGALIGAFTGAAFAAVGNIGEVGKWASGGIRKVIAHGFVGGISNKLRGGDFFKGFLSAALTQRFAPVVDVVGLVGNDSKAEQY